MKNIIKKYNVFIKYIFSAGICFTIDLLLFTIFNSLLKSSLSVNSIIVATIIARVISSTINYLLNRNKVFKFNSDGSVDKNSLIKYFTLVIIQMLVSSYFVLNIYKLTLMNETLIKLLVDIVIFIVNFFIQKIFIFNDKKIKYSNTVLLIFSILSSVAFIYYPVLTENLIKFNYNGNVILGLVSTLLIYMYYKKFYNNVEKRNSFKFISIIFTLLLIFGYSFNNVDSGALVYSDIQYMLLSIFKFIGYYIFINLSLNVLYEYLNKIEIKEKIYKNKYIIYFKNHPFISSLIVLGIWYTIFLIAFYPGVFGYDPSYQIKEVMGIPNFYSESIKMGNSTLTAFNPVVHTLLIGGLFKVGYSLGNVNFGLFLYTLIQMVCTILVLSYSIKFLKDENVPTKLLLVILGIYVFVPIFPFYSICAFKDTYFSLFFILFIIELYRLIKYKMDFKRILILTLVSFGLCMFRKNGIITIYMTLPIFFIAIKNNRKGILISMLLIFLLNFSYNKIIDYFDIAPTSIRETLSVPFQQTAALIVNKEEVISYEDREIISKILDYDNIKNLYDPELADPVKNTFNKNYTDEELTSYMKVWFKYLLKEPKIYIEATINNIYGYFYPDAQDWYFYYKKYNVLNDAGFDYHYNKLNILRSILYNYGIAFEYIPLIGLLVNIGMTTWIYIYLTGHLIENKNKKYILLFIPALTILLATMAGPVNTYYRYVLPYSMSLPFLIAIIYKRSIIK